MCYTCFKIKVGNSTNEIKMTKNLKETHTFGRHGEIILKQVNKIPKGAKLVESGESIIVGHSESGHNHLLTLERGTGIIKMYEIDGKTYLDIPRKADLVHQKSVEQHETQTFAPGKYVREIRHSYSYALGVMRRVQD
jgi:hypothetical protein